MKIRSWLAFAALLAAAAPAASQDASPPSYAVLSLVGDKLDIVTWRQQTGSLTDVNDHQTLAVADGEIDRVGRNAARDALSRSAPGAPVALYAATSPAVYDDEAHLFDGRHVTLPPDLAAAIAADHATRLVLLTKHRGEANLSTLKSHVGSGKLEGLGFYIDPRKGMRRADTGERAQGFLAPYVYVDVSLVDVATSTVLRRSAITVGEAMSSARNPDGSDPWGALTAAQKIAILDRMLTRGVNRAIPALLAPETPPASN